MNKTKEKKKSSKIITILRIVFWTLLAVLILISAWFEKPVVETIDLGGNTDNPIRCVLITDLHSCYYGKNQKNLIKMVDKQNPDIVFLGGDIFDDKIGDKNAEIFLEDISKKYECFYVSGNHEYWSERIDEQKEKVRKLGIPVLEGDCVTVEINGKFVDVCGADDPTRLYDRQFVEQLDKAYAQTKEDHIKVLLTHRPERVDVYSNYDFDLILAGHAHAGQFRIPFVNIGVYAPNQGIFAKYVSGKYTLDNGSMMIVSRGLARESTPLPRFFNHPEIVVFDL